MDAAARPLDERAVLVVDDEPAVCRMTARILTDAGLPALEAPDGEKAVGLLDRLGVNAVWAVVSDRGLATPGSMGPGHVSQAFVLWRTC